jgi:pantothenate kinase-related protein Tda10
MKNIIKKPFKPKVRFLAPVPSGKFRTSFYFTAKELELPDSVEPMHLSVLGDKPPTKSYLSKLRAETLREILASRANLSADDFMTTAEDPGEKE